MTDPPTKCPNCNEPNDKKGHCSCTRPDWNGECMNCGSTPVVPATGLCGPCTFGEADTLGGNW